MTNISGAKKTRAAHYIGIQPSCSADRLLRMLWGEWTTHILRVLGDNGPQRFVRLRNLIVGVSPKVLTTRLRRMEADGLLWRNYEPEVPPKVTYGLTERGQALHDQLKGLDPIAADWFGTES